MWSDSHAELLKIGMNAVTGVLHVYARILSRGDRAEHIVYISYVWSFCHHAVGREVKVKLDQCELFC